MRSRATAIKGRFPSSHIEKKSAPGTRIAWYLQKHWPYAIFAACIACVFAQTIGYSFSPMDDRWLILSRQPLLSDIRNLPSLFSESTLEHFYRPVLNATFMLDTLAGNGSEKVYHFTNILLHVFSCCLLFRFFIVLSVGRAAAFWCTLLFALHPINVQAVTWIPGRNDTLLFLFIIGAAIALISYITSGNALWIVLHFFCFAGALFTKETALLSPLVFSALLYMHREHVRVSTIIVLLAAWLSFCIAFFWIHAVITSPAAVSVDADVHVFRFVQDMILQLGKMILPVQQSVVPLGNNVSSAPYVVALGLVAYLLWKRGAKNPRLILTGVTLCLAFLFLPTWFGAGNDVPIQYEHRVYLPLAGLLLFITQINFHWRLIRPAFLLIPVVIIFAGISLRRHSIYKDALTYAVAATIEAPQIPMFHDIAGFELYQQNKFQVAINYFNEAIRLDSTHAEYYNHRGITWSALNQHRNAIYNYNRVLKMRPDQKETYVNRSMAYYAVKDYDDALRDFRSADSLGATIAPEYAHALEKALQSREPVAEN